MEKRAEFRGGDGGGTAVSSASSKENPVVECTDMLIHKRCVRFDRQYTHRQRLALTLFGCPAQRLSPGTAGRMLWHTPWRCCNKRVAATAVRNNENCNRGNQAKPGCLRRGLHYWLALNLQCSTAVGHGIRLSRTPLPFDLRIGACLDRRRISSLSTVLPRYISPIRALRHKSRATSAVHAKVRPAKPGDEVQSSMTGTLPTQTRFHLLG